MPAAAPSQTRVRCLAALCGLLLAATCASQAGAEPTYTAASKQVHVVDFSNLAGQFVETNGPIDLGGGVIWSAWQDGWVGDMSFGLRANGYWDAGRVGFAGLNADNSAMVFQFESPIARVGALVNYAPLNGQGPVPTIEALDAWGRVFDSISLDVSTPNGVNEGQFLGFDHGVADIFAFRYRARYGVLDDLTWCRDGSGFIPAPSSLVSLGVVFLGCARRRRRSS